jgi:hypothetical protein
MAEILAVKLKGKQRLSGVVSSSGSGGTMACAYRLKEEHSGAKLGVAEALQCPTLLQNGFGGHRIEGIGDKHVPWIHDCKRTDMVIATDDEDCIRALRLFNEEKGRELLIQEGVSKEVVDRLNLLGISGIGNLVSAIKMAKYYEMTEDDIIFTVFTDSLDLYGSRLKELEVERGPYSESNAHRDYERFQTIGIDNLLELSYYEKKRVHNLKYFTWIEQQERELEELNRQWYDHEEYWASALHLGPKIDEMISEFNEMIGA